MFAVGGKGYSSFMYACRVHGLNPTDVREKLSHGATMEEAFGLESASRENQLLNKEKVLSTSLNAGCKEEKVNGRVFPTRKAAYLYYDVNGAFVLDRMRSGLTFEEAINAEVAFKNEGGRRSGKSSKKKVEVRGVEFDSLADACSHYGKSESYVRKLVSNGFSLEEALLEKGRDTSVVVEGRKFASKKEACEYYGVTYQTVNNRVREGMSFEEAVVYKRKKKPEANNTSDTTRTVTVNGKKFSSKIAALRYYGVTEYLVNKRMSAGFSFEEAVNIEHYRMLEYEKKKEGGKKNSVSYNEKKVTVMEKEFDSYSDACAFYNVHYSSVRNLMRNKGWSFEKAVLHLSSSEGNESKGRKTYEKKEKVYAFGKEFPSVAEACRYYNISYGMVKGRMDNAYTLEEAISMGNERISPNSKGVTVEGRDFKSVAEACRFYKVTPARVSVLVKGGRTYEEAILYLHRTSKPRKRKETGNIPIEYRGIVVDGVEYPSVAEACRVYGESYSKVMYMLNNGYTPNEAFGIEQDGWGSFSESMN